MLNCWSSTINCWSSNFTIILKGSLLTESHLGWNFRLYIKLWIHKIFWKWMLTRGKCNLTLFSPSQTYWLFYFNSSGILSKDYRNHFPINKRLNNTFKQFFLIKNILNPVCPSLLPFSSLSMAVLHRANLCNEVLLNRTNCQILRGFCTM